MGELHFLRPLLLLSLIGLVPLVSLVWYLGFQLRVKARKVYGEEKLVNRFSKPLRLASEGLLLGGWLVAVVAIAIAAAGPVVPDAPTNVQAGSLQVVVVSDVSKSMAAEDYRSVMPPKVINGQSVPADQVPGPYGSRLDMTKYVIINQIMPAIRGNQLGVVTYCGNGFDRADLGDDFNALTWVINNWMVIDGAPGGGSDYAEGLKEALNLFHQTPDPKKDKVIVLFSDGGFTGDPAALDKVIQQVQAEGIRVIVVGIGGDAALPIPLYSDDGQLTGYKQKDGQTVATARDGTALQGLASKLNATYIPLEPGKPLGIQWASTLTTSKTEKHENHVFQYPLGVGLGLLLVLFLRGAVTARRRQQ
jgi:hypothetical protein